MKVEDCGREHGPTFAKLRSAGLEAGGPSSASTIVVRPFELPDMTDPELAKTSDKTIGFLGHTVTEMRDIRERTVPTW